METPIMLKNLIYCLNFSTLPDHQKQAICDTLSSEAMQKEMILWLLSNRDADDQSILHHTIRILCHPCNPS